MSASTDVFYTIGHASRRIDEFVALLRVGGVSQLVDVRAMPRSRTNPQFNREVLPETLRPFGIAYRHCAALGGMRKQSQTVAGGINAYWHNRSFHNYADHALSASFTEAIASLMQLGRHRTCAVMCAEAVWWRCHRRIIADHLIHRGAEVYHLMDQARVQPASMTEAARVSDEGNLIYPAIVPS